METFKHNGYTIQIVQDEDAQSPEDWGDDGIFIVTTRNRYFEVLHDKQDAKACMEDKDLCKKYWVFPVNAYIHSGVALSLGAEYPFNDQWDSGQIGFVFCAKSEWKYRTRNTKRCSSAQKVAECHIEEWNKYLSGDVWGYIIKTPEGEELESCWGFYGQDYCIEEAKNAVPEEPALVGGESEDEAFEECLA